jgi:hypothetical protein
VRKNLLTFGLIAVVLALLVGLNLVFLSEPRRDENESNGDRASYKGTPYGTLAFYTLLEESGRPVVRFEQPYTELAGSAVETLLVVVPHPNHQPSREEIDALDAWILEGGKLVVVDRFVELDFADFSVTTSGRARGAVRPIVPSMLTRGARGLRTSDFATTLEDSSGESVVHFASETGPLVVDRPYGDGHVTFVAEPYILQNNGIREGDNLALAFNLVGDASGGSIAFDEYHHGYGSALGGSGGGLRGYIAGTPVPWIVLQLGLVCAAIAFTVGRRFGKPIPLASERRTSALEFVGSMASIQRLAGASDLAVENISASFRTRLCRYAGLSSAATSVELARAAAARGRVDESELLTVLRRCESALAGHPPSRDELVALVAKIRTIEQQLKI